MKQGEESSKKKEMKKKMEKDFESKRVKAKQEYSKWLKKKHIHKTQKSIKKLR